MAAHHRGDAVSENRPHVRVPFTIQCRRCLQRIMCCPGCGVADFLLLDGAAVPTRPAATRRCVRTTAGTPTAFELFCLDAEAKLALGDCGHRNELGNEEEEEEEERCEKRRLLAESWLSADVATRKRYEVAAATAVAGVSLPTRLARAAGKKESPGQGNRNKKDKKSRDANEPEAPKVVNTDDAAAAWDNPPKLVKLYKRPPTSFTLFCKRHRQTYGNRSALVNAWKAMGAAEKQPYDDEAAAIRVVLKK